MNVYERVKFAVQARLRRAQRACEGAERGMGPPRATPGPPRRGLCAVGWCEPGSEQSPGRPRRARRACEGAGRGMGPPRATEPGSGAEPRLKMLKSEQLTIREQLEQRERDILA